MKWVLVAIDEVTARNLAEDLLGHMRRYRNPLDLADEADMLITSQLILCLTGSGNSTAEEMQALETIWDRLRRTNSEMSGNEQGSRRLNWPHDSEWIEAQSRAGKLA